MKKIFLLISTITMLLLSGCTTTPDTPMEATQQNAQKAIAAAEARYAEAIHAHVAWRKTHEFIAKAKEMAKVAKYKEAIDLADRAKLESDIAFQESAEYDKSWPDAVIK